MPDRVLAGRYRLGERLGSGGMGTSRQALKAARWAREALGPGR
ncbi:hypothetical protein GCM10010191_37590 [Actinomadura vinacea]|uniref:Serine/threonine protein kinase n=1 Tax=Actinomadura vinacea TaxID=115336 RepID=A0ABN3J6M9_9ACTN